MVAKRILLLDGPALMAHVWSAGRITLEGEFSHEPAGLEAFAAYLRKHRSSLFYVLADTVEEGFQLEDLPYVQGPDRTALLQRRLNQYYYNTPLSTAISLGRAADGRRDEKLLFAALTRVDTFTPWLDALREAEATLAGVYSVPLVLARFVPQFTKETGPLLFVSLTHGGVRQTFFDQGKLHFSRLSQLATHGLDEIGRTCAGDSAKIFQYLVAQRQVTRGVPLRTLVLASPGETPALREYCRNTAELEFEFVDLVAAARQQGLKNIPAGSNADDLFIHCLATRTPDQQFAPATERRFFRLWQVRYALTRTALTILAGCLVFAGKTAHDIYQLRADIEATQAATASDTQRYNSILEGLPKISISPDNLRLLTGRFDALQQRIPSLEPLLMHLGLALNENPKVELTRLGWRMANALDADDKGPKGIAPNAAPTPTSANGWMIVEIEAQLPLGLLTDRRAQLDLIDSFAARMRDPKTEVRVLARPFDIESDKRLRSTGDGSETRAAEVPRFSLRIARPM